MNKRTKERPTSGVDVLFHRNTDEVLIVRYVRLDLLTAYGNMYRYSNDEITSNAWNIIQKIVTDPFDLNVNEKAEYALMSSAKRKKYRGVSVSIYPSEVTIAPLEKVTGGYSGTIMFQIAMPIDPLEFNTKLIEAIKEAF